MRKEIIAVGDGLTDDTAAIQACLDSCSAGDTIYFGEGRRFRVNPLTGVVLPSGVTLELTGCEIFIQENSAKFNRVLVIPPGSRSISIHGGTVRGCREGGTPGAWGKGLEVSSAAGVLVEETIFIGHYFDGVWIGGNQPSKDVTLRKVTCCNNRRNGLSVTHADGVFLDGCTFAGQGGQDPQAGADFEPNRDERVDNIRIDRCSFVGNRGIGLYAHKGQGQTGKGYRVTQSHLEGNGAGLPSAQSWQASLNGMEGLEVYRCEFGRGQNGISIGAHASKVLVAKNEFREHQDTALRFAGAQDVTCVGNKWGGAKFKIVGLPDMSGVEPDVIIRGNEA